MLRDMLRNNTRGRKLQQVALVLQSNFSTNNLINKVVKTMTDNNVKKVKNILLSNASSRYPNPAAIAAMVNKHLQQKVKSQFA